MEVSAGSQAGDKAALVDRVAPADGAAGVAKAAGAGLQGAPVAGSAVRRPAAEDLVAAEWADEAVVRREVEAAGYLEAAVLQAVGCAAERPEVGSRQVVRVVAGYREVVLRGVECQAAFAAVPPGVVRPLGAGSAAGLEAVDLAGLVGVACREVAAVPEAVLQ